MKITLLVIGCFILGLIYSKPESKPKNIEKNYHTYTDSTGRVWCTPSLVTPSGQY